MASHDDFKMPATVRDVKRADVIDFIAKIDDLLDAIRLHPQMPPQPQDPSTPRPLYYLWDFVQRTRGNLASIPIAEIEANKQAALERYCDCKGRSHMAHVLVTDNRGVAAMMFGGPMEFGERVREKAKAASDAGGGEGYNSAKERDELFKRTGS